MSNAQFSASTCAVWLLVFAFGGAAQQSVDAPQPTPEQNQTQPGMMGAGMTGPG